MSLSQTSATHSNGAGDSGGAAGRSLRWRLGLVAALVLLLGLGWLLARLVWIYYYFGLFFYLVAGLLAGAVAFRIARAARPIEAGRLIRGVVCVSLLSSVNTMDQEYRHFAGTVGQQPRFPQARNAAVQAGRPAGEIREVAERGFREFLVQRYPPGGLVGYITWSVRSGETQLEVEGDRAMILNDHRGVVWPVRTLGAALLLAAGLWFALESLRRAEPTTNVLQPGEEYTEEE